MTSNAAASRAQSRRAQDGPSTTPQAHRLAHVERIAVRWGDMDAMGHVNNTVYFRFMEQARISWFDALAPDREDWNGGGVVIANAACNFLRPIAYPGVVEVRLFAGPPGGSSVATSYELRVERNGTLDPALCADGAAMVVFIDAVKQKPVRVPARIRARLEQLEAGAAGA